MLKYVDSKGNIYSQDHMTKREKKKYNITGQYYFIDDIEDTDSDINMVVSARNLGKSVSLGDKIIKEYFEKDIVSAFVRRYKDQFNDPNMRGIFEDSIALGALNNPKNTDGWDNIKYMKQGWYLTRFDEELSKDIISDEPICVGIGLNLSGQKARGMKNRKLRRLYFDEFVAKGYGDDAYFPGEYGVFIQLINTLARMKDDFKVYMFGNTQGQMEYCPYFEEFGIDLDMIAKGKITRVRNYSEEHEGYLAIEWVNPRDDDMKPDGSKFNYFQKDGKDAQMTENGDWETRIFPHLDFTPLDKEIKKEFYIWYGKYILKGQIVKHEDRVVMYMSEAWKGYTEAEARDMISKLRKPLVFSPYAEGQKKWFKFLTKPTNDTTKFILSFFTNNLVYYETNMVGETFQGYINYCNNAGLVEAR